MDASQLTDCCVNHGNDTGDKDRQRILILLGITILLAQSIYCLTYKNSFLSGTNEKKNPAFTLRYQQNDYNLDFLFKSDHRGEDAIFSNTNYELPADIAPLFLQPIQINKASAQLLATIPGIGPKLAQELFEFIKKNGSVSTVDELIAVKGIGDKKLKIIAKHVKL